jgi:hypothetical protein
VVSHSVQEDGDSLVVMVTPIIDLSQMSLGGDDDEYVSFPEDATVKSNKKEAKAKKQVVEKAAIVEAVAPIVEKETVEKVVVEEAAPVLEETAVKAIVDELISVFKAESPAAAKPISRKATLEHYRKVSVEDALEEDEAFVAPNTLTRAQKKKAAYRAKKKAAKHAPKE